MDLIEAQDILDKAFVGQGVTVGQHDGKGAYIISKGEETLARNFDLLKAVRAACLPVLERARSDHKAAQEQKQALFLQFGVFLQEKFKDEFGEWLAARTEAKPEEKTPGKLHAVPAEIQGEM